MKTTRNKSIIYSVFVVTVITGILLGCSKNFLNVPPQGQQTAEDVALDPNAAANLVLGTYNTLYFGGFDPNTVGLEWVMTVEIASDDADKGSTDGDSPEAKQIDQFKIDTHNSFLDNLWRGHYQAIGTANQALAVLNNATFDEATKKRFIAETRFLRGFYYFDLVRLFGGVPLILQVPNIKDTAADYLYVKKPVDSVYAAIVADLQYAADNLPLRGESGAVDGRANRGAAEAFLAKVYLYMKNYQKAYDLSKDIINSGKYSLVPYPYYAQIFRENAINGAGGVNNTESIFEVQTAKNTTCDAISKLYSNGQGPRATKGWVNQQNGIVYNGDLGFGFNNPSQSLVSAYDELGDSTRKFGTVIFIQPTGGNNAGTTLWDGFRIPTQDSVQNPRYNYKAYHSPFKESEACGGPNDKDNKPKNIRLMRFAEVLLINAEAAVQIGNSGDAQSALDAIRTRAGLTSVPATLDNIYRERRVEMAMECDRFFDLVRTNRAVQFLGPLGFQANRNEVFPIPQNQIDLSGGKLKQNPGYN